MNIKAMDIIMEYLESNGYNGTFNSDEYACRILPPYEYEPPGNEENDISIYWKIGHPSRKVIDV